MLKVNQREIHSIEDIKNMEDPTREDFTDAILWMTREIENLSKQVRSYRESLEAMTDEGNNLETTLGSDTTPHESGFSKIPDLW